MGAQYAIMRFAKYKGAAVSSIEAHNERMKDIYKSNPDIDLSRTELNFHLVEPPPSYRIECERKIKEAGCKVRKDSVRMVETLVTASPEFFEGKSPQEIRAFFQEALNFFTQKQRPETILSAVVHMDEKTPHMHMTFVPLTQDNRLSAKEIVGNKQKLTLWQDQFWSHMVEKYPDLERGESASLTGRTHIPPRLFKEATKLERLQEQIKQLMSDVNPFNAKKRVAKLEELLKLYIPKVEEMMSTIKKYEAAFKALEKERIAMEKQKVSLQKENIELRGQNFELSRKYSRDRKRLTHLEKAMEKVPKGIVDLYFKMEEQKDKDKEYER